MSEFQSLTDSETEGTLKVREDQKNGRLGIFRAELHRIMALTVLRALADMGVQRA